MNRILKGSGVGGGIAIGPTYVVKHFDSDAPPAPTRASNIQEEIDQLDYALQAAANELYQTKINLPADSRKEVAAFLDAHFLMIKDSSLRQATVGIIRERECSAEAALFEYRDQLLGMFEQIDDPYLRSKAYDVNQIIRQIQEKMPAATGLLAEEPAADDVEGFILVAQDLSPAEIVKFNDYAISGFVTDLGSPVSHVAILAHSLQMPAVVGLHGQTSEIPDGATVAIDSSTGTVVVEPSEQTLAELRRRQVEFEKRQEMLASLAHLKPTTLDGHCIKLLANVELPEDIDQAVSCGADGVGLYRTEFLFMNRETPPDEDEQFRAYADAAKRLGQVTIRTLDLGADKQVDGGREQGNVATNPALGIRAIRLCLKQPELFRPQLRAIFRSSVFGNVQCMIPMLSSIDELNEALAFIAGVRNELFEEGVEFDPDIPIGAMIEVPAAAIAADLFARRLDFLSIGTNDLIQYTLAIDRIDDEVNYLYDPMHLSVLYLVKNTIDAGVRAGTPVSMCGEMASDVRFTRLLLGMGLRTFSINPLVLPEIKQIVRGSRIDQIDDIVGQIVIDSESSRRYQLLEQLNSLDDEPAALHATA